ncbi:hypothetical protein [Paenibacillus sp. PAMC21692]|uniref:hypothetical protein n=1 Tax=Paenibacillus sp. PAMC21692 TaxID=2762320 RepID=UPI00164D85DE|nr:hypothetical protein [Paenibacillus sp. PAMC21692]QNK59092.1 hypothetical protein H7F31_09620 [Paenibacillus sp. PAMC21692]
MSANMAKGKRSPVMNVAFHLWSAYRHVLVWFWVIFTVIYFGINEMIMRGIIPDESIRNSGREWDGASIAPRIFLLVLGILLTIGSFNSFVSNGITRRSFGRGGLLFAGLLSIICTVLHLLGYPIEMLIIEISGAERSMQYPNLAIVAITNLLMYFGYFCGGWLIGTGFYRFHWFKGLLVCGLAVAFLIGMETMTATELTGSAAADQGIILLVLALASFLIVWINDGFLRKISVKRKITL